MKASEIEPGMVLKVSGSMLHDDLRGLICEVKVEWVEIVDDTPALGSVSSRHCGKRRQIVTVHHSGGLARTWWYGDEEVRLA